MSHDNKEFLNNNINNYLHLSVLTRHADLEEAKRILYVIRPASSYDKLLQLFDISYWTVLIKFGTSMLNKVIKKPINLPVTTRILPAVLLWQSLFGRLGLVTSVTTSIFLVAQISKNNTPLGDSINSLLNRGNLDNNIQIYNDMIRKTQLYYGRPAEERLKISFNGGKISDIVFETYLASLDKKFENNVPEILHAVDDISFSATDKLGANVDIKRLENKTRYNSKLPSSD